MPQPQRTRKLRRIKVKLPGGKVTIHYEKRKPQIAHCAFCRKILHGIPRKRPVEIKKLPKSQRRPKRMFAGYLCPSCTTKEVIKRFNAVNEKIEIGRLIVKTRGRDAGKLGVIIDLINDNYALIDGQVRRKKCNIQHIETLDKKIKIKPKAPTDTIIKELKKLNIDIKKTKPKPKKERPRKQRKQSSLKKNVGEEKKKPKEEKPKASKSKKEKIKKKPK